MTGSSTPWHDRQECGHGSTMGIGVTATQHNRWECGCGSATGGSMAVILVVCSLNIK